MRIIQLSQMSQYDMMDCRFVESCPDKDNLSEKDSRVAKSHNKYIGLYTAGHGEDRNL